MVNSKILIVEDESIVAMDLKQRLERLNCTVVGIEAKGIDAIKKTGETDPDLVLMDILLNGEIDGIETASQIREMYNIPFIYITGSHDNKILEKAETTGPLGYLMKPFDDVGIKNAIQAFNSTKL